jgi:hypothetical protein
MPVEKLDPALRWPVLAACQEAINWLEIQANLGLAPRTIEAYARGPLGLPAPGYGSTHSWSHRDR